MKKQCARAKACYIEDVPDWREAVSSFLINEGSYEYFDFASIPSVKEEFEKFLEESTGPLILIMDLRMEDGTLAGFDWLNDEVENFVTKVPNTVIAVLSGQLNDAIESKLKSLGIPENHIFDKGDWWKNQTDFFNLLKNTAIMLNAKPSTRKFDPYLSNQIWNVYEDSAESAPESKSTGDEVFLLLVKLKDANWDGSKVPDLKILGRIGKIFSCEGTIRTIEHLEQEPAVESIESSRPSAPPESEKSLNFIGPQQPRKTTNELGDSVIIGIIDVGIDILHETFLDETGKKSRILSVWDQRDSQGPSPQLKDVTPNGTEHDREKINEYLKNNAAPPMLGQSTANEHGTHVTSIAAGCATRNYSVGIAPAAKIIAVIIPSNSNGNSNGSDYSSCVVSALQYLKEKAKEEGLPLVINISQGINSGGRDGSSLLEEAIDAITDNGEAEGLVVVKSAGNERDKKAHASIRMTADDTEELKWSTDLSNNYFPFKKDFVELWFDSKDTLLFSLQVPSDERRSNEVGLLNNLASGEFRGGHKYKMEYYMPQMGKGAHRLLIETNSKIYPSNASLEWTLHIKSTTVNNGEIHAWLERTTIGRPTFLNHIDEDCTLTVPGTSHHIISVGATTPTTPFVLSDYSSRGPTRDRREKPDISAPGEEIFAATCGGNYCLVSGTSMAAPLVTGAIGLLFSHWHKKRDQIPDWKQLKSHEIREALIKSTQQKGWDKGFGYGVLDLEKLFKLMGIAAAGQSNTLD